MSDNRIVDCEQNGVVNASFACQNVTNSKKRIGYIDSLKGFLILCVALGHIIDGFLNAGVYSEHSDVMNALYIILYSFHMPTFFLVSGYLFSKAYISSQLSDAIVFSVLIVVLLVRPTGILGKERIEKV